MALFKRKKKTTTKSKAKSPAKKSTTKSKAAKGGQSKEAQAVLAKMKAKSDAGDCAFC